MTVPVVASSTTNSAGSTTTLTMTKPSGVTAGDLLIVVCGSEAGSTNGYQTAPSGWTLVNYSNQSSSVSISAFWRIADGSEPSTTDFTQSITRDSWGTYLRITGAHPSSPIHVVGSDYAGAAAGTHNITGVTTSVADCLAFVVGSAPNTGAYSYSITGWTVTNLDSGGGSACSGFRATKSQASAGATGTATVDFGGDSVELTAFQFAVAPAPPTVTGTSAITGGEAPNVSAAGKTVVTGTAAIVGGEAPNVNAGNPFGAIVGGEAPNVSAAGKTVVTGTAAIVGGEAPNVFGVLQSEGAIVGGEAPNVAAAGAPVVRGSGAITVGEAPNMFATVYREAEAALVADLDIFALEQYRVVLRATETGIETVLGTGLSITGISIADGDYSLRVEADGRFWRSARFATEYPISIVGGVIVQPLPPIQSLAAVRTATGILVSWVCSPALGEATPVDFGVWSGSSSPVSVAGAPVETATFAGAGGYLVSLAASPTTTHVAVASRSGASIGPVSEVAIVNPPSSIGGPTGVSARTPDGRWSAP